MPISTALTDAASTTAPRADQAEGFTAAAARREAAALFTRWVDDLAAGALDCPPPGSGRTADRFAALTRAGRRELSAARLFEGHVDAAAILAELGAAPPLPGERWGVWAAEPPGTGLTATRTEQGWELNGRKAYCSGAHICTHALVTANAEDGRRLFAVRTGSAGNGDGTGGRGVLPDNQNDQADQRAPDAPDAPDGHGPRGGREGGAVRDTPDERGTTAAARDGRGTPGTGCRPVAGTWQALGMAGSDTPDVRFDRVAASPVGGVAAYLTRPGFQHGGIGVAACWYGGARAVADTLLRQAAGRGPDPFTDAHLGAVDMRLHAADAVLRRAADEIDLDPDDTAGTARVRSLRTRAFVESVCADVLTEVGRATGAGPLCHDERHARNTADLAVYIRQHHAERNLAELGALIARKEPS